MIARRQQAGTWKTYILHSPKVTVPHTRREELHRIEKPLVRNERIKARVNMSNVKPESPAPAPREKLEGRTPQIWPGDLILLRGDLEANVIY